MARFNRSQFKFQRHDSIGAEAAEQDTAFLRECFVDTGDLARLRDTRDPRRIVVGRTGAGKTALLLLLSTVAEHVSWIDPDQLSLAYLANSTILRHLDALGVNLDLFYRLLWRHVFTIELIQLKWGLRSEADQVSFFARVRQMFAGDKRKDEAMAYLTQWGENFWKDTEYRIHEVTTKFEDAIRASLGAKLPMLEAGAHVSDSTSLEDRREIVHRAQEVVNRVQIQKLSQVIDILAEDVFGDDQQGYHVLVDRLDENWVPDPLRYKLIRALIETVKDLQKVRNAKLVIALRKDLLQRVFRETRDAGFQEEKYEAMYLPLSWSPDALMTVMDKRLNRLVRHRFSGQLVTWRDLFPPMIGPDDTADYLVSRTLYRPRDIIQFCNVCIELAPDRPEVTAQVVREAESKYSTLRFRSLGDEWAADFPELLHVAELLKRRPTLFAVSEITVDQLDGFCLEEIAEDRPSRLFDDFKLYYDGAIPFEDLRARVIKTFYEVGLVGLKQDVSRPISWSFLERDVLRVAEIGSGTRVAICPMFYRVLGTEQRH